MTVWQPVTSLTVYSSTYNMIPLMLSKWRKETSIALWGERERSRRQYSSQVSVFKPALFIEHSNADKMKKRPTVADSMANVGESGDRDRCLGTSVAYLGVHTCP